MNVFGRMSCQVFHIIFSPYHLILFFIYEFERLLMQVPGGIALIGAMLIWYRSVSAVVFWQWANQSFNALVNYTNRNAKSPTSPK